MKMLMFGDAHYGARSNSQEHLEDSLEYTDWFIDLAIKEKATHIGFLGDFYENRNSLNIRSLNAGTEACRRLNALGIPVYFLVGNHDLYHRNSRKIFSTDPYKDLENFIVVNEPMELAPNMFASPFLFREEYPELAEQINSYKYVLGHFEFRNFVVTGATRTLDHGPDADAFSGPKYIFTGHFHKRQTNKNIVYIGNPFPTNYGDAWDNERGACLLEINEDGTDEVSFFNYEKAPLFYKVNLSQVLAGELTFAPKGRVRCILDADVSYSDVQSLREEMIKTFSLREFSVEEDLQSKQDILLSGVELEAELDTSSLDATVRQLIKEGVQQTATIDPELLIQIYEELGSDV